MAIRPLIKAFEAIPLTEHRLRLPNTLPLLYNSTGRPSLSVCFYSTQGANATISTAPDKAGDKTRQSRKNGPKHLQRIRDKSRVWRTLGAQDSTCHSCHSNHPEGRPPKYHNGYTTFRGVAAGKTALKSQLPLSLVTPTWTSPSSKSLLTALISSRSFSTFHSVWTTPDDEKSHEEAPVQTPRSPVRVRPTSEAEVIEAKRQLDLARQAWNLAKDSEPRTREKSKTDVYQAKLKHMRVYRAWKMATDPVYREREHASQRRWSQQPSALKTRARYMQRPGYQSRHAEQMRVRRATNPDTRERDRVYRWVSKYPMVRRLVDWAPYKPILYSQKAKHYCQGCMLTKYGGLRLWWKRNASNADVYSCHNCFVGSAAGGLPEAYKDCTSVRELNKRVEQLEGVYPKLEPEVSDLEAGQDSTRT